MTSTTNKASAPETAFTETTRISYRAGGLEPVLLVTADGLHTRLWYYETDKHPLDIDPLVEGLTLQKAPSGTNATTGACGKTLADAAQLTCTERPAAGKGLLPLCAQYQYLLLPDGTRQAPTLTLFGYALSQRDDQGTLVPNTVLTFEGLEAFEDSDTLALNDVKLKKLAGLSVALVQVNHQHQANAIRSSERIATQWYQDDNARNTQTVTEVVAAGKQTATHELLRTSPYSTGTATLQRQVVSARTGRLLRETQQDGDGKPVAFICHEYDSLGRGVLSTTYRFSEAAFTSGDVSGLEPNHTRTIGYAEYGHGNRVRDCDAQGRHQQCYYDGLQRIVRRELQRLPGNDHSAANYCVTEQTHWGTDGQIATHVAFDYLPGGLRIDDIKTLPQRSEGWFWQTHGHDTPVTDAEQNESLTSRSTLGLFSKGALTTHQSTQNNNADGSVTLAHEAWEGVEQPASGPAIKTTETINKKGQRERLVEQIPGYAAKERQWDIGYDDLGRQVSVTRPDKSIVSWAYQGLNNVPTSVSVKPSSTAKAKVLASRTLDGGAVATVIRGSDTTQTFKARQGGWVKPDGTAVYREPNADGSVSWYATSDAGTTTPLMTFKLSAVSQALLAERPKQGDQQSLVTSETLKPLLLGSWHYNRTVHGRKQREEGVASLRGKLSGAWSSDGLAMQAWENAQGYRSRLRRGTLEYRYQYTALGQLAMVSVDDMRSGQRLQVDYSYDAFGRETERSYQLNGQTKVRYVQTWSAGSQLLSKTLFRDGSQVRSETFVYNTSVTGTSDELQKWTVVAETGEEVKDDEGYAIEEQSYEYDVLGSLTKCTSKRKKDGTVEDVVRTYTYGDEQHPTRRTKVTCANKTIRLTYDLNGNLLTNEREQTLAYTNSGRLRSVTAKGAITPLTYYEYDEYDRLIAQWDAASNQRRILSYSGDRLNGETWLNSTGKVLKRQLLDDEASLAVALNGQWRFVLGDPQNGGGDEYLFKDGNWEYQSVAFTPWGETHLASLKAQGVGVGYNGQRVDPVTGGYHLGAGYRLYDPVHKVFYQPDDWSPLGAGGLNDRAYCASGDPVNWHDPSGHIMLNRQAQAHALARLDDVITALTPNTEQAPPEAAGLKNWLIFGAIVIIGAIAIIASAGTLGPVVAGVLLAVFGAGAAVTAAGMALRQKDPELSATLEPIGQVMMAVASAPAIGSQMATVAKYVLYGATLAYAGLEIARVAVQKDNPELAQKLGWASLAVSLVSMVSSLRSVQRLFSRVGQALRSLRGSLKSFHFRDHMNRSRSWMYAPGNTQRPSFNQRLGKLTMQKLGMRTPQRVNGRIGYYAGNDKASALPSTSQSNTVNQMPGNGAKGNSSLLSGTFQTAWNSLIRGPHNLPTDQLPNRAELSSRLGAANSSQPFSQAVEVVNSNLASNAAADISAAKLEQYTQLTQDVDSGRISNTTAFFASSGGWVGDSTSSLSDRLVGAVLNCGGAVVSAGLEDNARKTGKIFR